MRKKRTLNQHIQIANETMSYIYEYIDTNINIDELALSFGISKHHLHKLFKQQMGVNIYETIKSNRLQKASNLLLTNKHSTITQISNMCGYSSHTSFIRAFKERFGQTPKDWRQGGYKEYSKDILKNYMIEDSVCPKFNAKNVQIVKTPQREIYYLRQKGYILEEGKEKWQKLQAWVYSNSIKNYESLGIYHDNPAITPHNECFYIAAICPKEKLALLDTNLPSYTMQDGLYAAFEIEGKKADVGLFIHWVYHEWLPMSGFETTTHPSFVIMNKNHILDKEREVDGTYYLPIRYT